MPRCYAIDHRRLRVRRGTRESFNSPEGYLVAAAIVGSGTTLLDTEHRTALGRAHHSAIVVRASVGVLLETAFAQRRHAAIGQRQARFLRQ
jgi:hypothetical protein